MGDTTDKIGDTQDKPEEKATLEQTVHGQQGELEKLQATLAKVMSNFDRVNTQLQESKRHEEELKTSKLSATEKTQKEINDLRTLLEDQKTENRRQKTKERQIEILREMNIDIGYLDLVKLDDDEEAFKVTVMKLDERIKAAVQKNVDDEVGKRFQGSTKTEKTGDNGSTEMNEDNFMNLSIVEQREWMKEHPEAWNKLQANWRQ